MNKVLIVLPLLGALAATTPALAGSKDPGINRMQANQQRRIREGFRCGDLTRKEVRKLERRELRIARMERQMKCDGGLTKRERARLHEALEKASCAIYRERHDGQQR